MLDRLIGENIDLTWLPDDNLKSIKMDSSQIDQILVNLCVNAKDAIENVGKITIETHNYTIDEAYCKVHAGFVPGDYVTLIVSDNGKGMDEDILKNIFDPFFTTKELGKGTGLGLATVFGIVKQNNGFINVYSEPDHGTSFKIYIPVFKKENKNTSDTNKKIIVPKGTETILLTEDDKSILKMATKFLESLGYNVLSASSPKQSIQLASEYSGKIHLLLTDVIMPGMNGRELSEKLLSLYPDMKLLYMSGYTANVIEKHGVLDDEIPFLHKPFQTEDLSLKVREVLDTTV